MTETSAADEQHVPNGVRRRSVLKGAVVGTAAASAAVALPTFAHAADPASEGAGGYADLILHRGELLTLDPRTPLATAVAVTGNRIAAVGTERDVMRLRGPATRVVDLGGRMAIPGLNDSHTHLLRGGLNFMMELRWDGLTSLAEALRRLKSQAARTPPPQWVRVVGGWSRDQFTERRLPTLEEINKATGDTPALVLFQYSMGFINRAGLRVLGFDRTTPDPPGGAIEHDAQGNPTGVLFAKPDPRILYGTIGRLPRLAFADQLNSTQQFMREVNRFGITSAMDAGGGGQAYPSDYGVVQDLHGRGLMTTRLAASIFPQTPGAEYPELERWTRELAVDNGDDVFRVHGPGETLVWNGVDFDNFLEPIPVFPPEMEADLDRVIRNTVQRGWPFRYHASYDQSIDRFLGVMQTINRDVPVNGVRWILDHAETISARNIDRVAELGGGIAVQHQMAFQGDIFREQYGDQVARRSPPVGEMLRAGVHVGMGTDATRVASYNPWVGLWWLVTGRTLAGTRMRAAENNVDRLTALKLYTQGSAWLESREGDKGTLAAGRLADIAVLSDDYLKVPVDRIKEIESVLTVMDGKIVYAAGAYGELAPAPLPISPDWSPVGRFGGYPHSEGTGHLC